MGRENPGGPDEGATMNDTKTSSDELDIKTREWLIGRQLLQSVKEVMANPALKNRWLTCSKQGFRLESHKRFCPQIRIDPDPVSARNRLALVEITEASIDELEASLFDWPVPPELLDGVKKAIGDKNESRRFFSFTNRGFRLKEQNPNAYQVEILHDPDGPGLPFELRGFVSALAEEVRAKIEGRDQPVPAEKPHGSSRTLVPA